jgi:death on curing protein
VSLLGERVEPTWPPFDEILRINRDAVAKTDEPHLIIDQGRLEGGYYRPRFHWWYGEDDVVTLAVHLLFGIAWAHGFEQGNKRTGFTAAVMFLSLNGYNLTFPDSQTLGRIIEQVITNEISQQKFAEIIRPHVTPL